eukprot:1751501-Rhodomonas_salina.1
MRVPGELREDGPDLGLGRTSRVRRKRRQGPVASFGPGRKRVRRWRGTRPAPAGRPLQGSRASVGECPAPSAFSQDLRPACRGERGYAGCTQTV